MRYVTKLAAAAGAMLCMLSAQAGDGNLAAREAAALDALARETYAAAAAFDRTDGARSASRLEELERDLASRRKALMTRDESASDGYREKLRRLETLAAAFARAAREPGRTLLPARLDAGRRRNAGILGGVKGGDCASALGLGADREIDGMLPAGASVWLRFDAPGPAMYRIRTDATPLDTAIDVYARCPGSGEAPLATSDDAFGLAASAAIDLRATPGPRWARVSNRGPAGEVAIVAGAAGSIAGRVLDALSGQPVADADLRLFDGNGFPDAYTATGPDGTYLFAADPGDYYVSARSTGYVARIWPDIYCADPYWTCNFASATPISVTAGGMTAGIDFRLTPGARIAGRAYDRYSGAPITYAMIDVVNAQGSTIGYAGTDEVGRYYISALPPGGHYALASAQAHVTQVYDGIDCGASCDPLQGERIEVADGETATDIDFALAPELHVDATVNLSDAGQDFFTVVAVYDLAGNLAADQYVISGMPQSVGPLAAGTYRVAARSSGYFAQLYDHVNCPGDCAALLAQGTPVSVATGAPAPSVAFDLVPTPTLSGRVTDATSGAGLAGVRVEIWAPDGTYSDNRGSAEDGSYSFAHAPAGSYYVIAHSETHRDTAYPDAPCTDYYGYPLSGCALTQADTVSLAFGQPNVTGVDIAMPMNGSISGSVHYRTTGAAGVPIPNASLTLVDAQGSAHGYASSDQDGTYELRDVPPGTYYMETTDYRYFTQIYSSLDCPLVGQVCNPAGGTPLSIAQGQSVTGIDFVPIGTKVIVGRVADGLTGLGIGGAVLDSWRSDDDSHCGTAVTDAAGYYAIDDSTSYCYGSARKLSTDAGASFTDQVYDGIFCPDGPAYLGLCPLDGATLLPLPATFPDPIVADFALYGADVVFRSGFD